MYKEKLTDKPNVNEGWRFRVDHPAHINKDGHQLKAQFLKFPAEYGMLQAHLECRDKIYQYLYGEKFNIKIYLLRVLLPYIHLYSIEFNVFQSNTKMGIAI